MGGWGTPVGDAREHPMYRVGRAIADALAAESEAKLALVRGITEAVMDRHVRPRVESITIDPFLTPPGPAATAGWVASDRGPEQPVGGPLRRPMPGTVWSVAWCPDHGLHGARDKCFECDRPVTQVEMIVRSIELPPMRVVTDTCTATRPSATKAGTWKCQLKSGHGGVHIDAAGESFDDDGVLV